VLRCNDLSCFDHRFYPAGSVLPPVKSRGFIFGSKFFNDSAALRKGKVKEPFEFVVIGRVAAASIFDKLRIKNADEIFSLML
jgi:hypothetical protein